MADRVGLAAGIIGGAGYSGGELCRLLLNHPDVDDIVPTSRADVAFERVHRNLAGCGLEFSRLEELLERAVDLDVVFLCTPSGEAMWLAPRLLEAGARIIDVSADFRFRDPATYQRAYGIEHAAPELLSEAACGITEFYREEVRGARIVANPGCYVIATVLGLIPAMRAGLADLDPPLHVHAVNGTTGAGNTPKRDIMHAEAFGSMLPYSMEGHRHGPELEARFGELTGHDVSVALSTAHGSFARGIYVQASLPLAPDRDATTRDELLDVYVSAFGRGHQKERFVLVNDLPKSGGMNAKEYDVYPSITGVTGSNFCHVGVDYDAGHRMVKVISVIDNLVKGAAGSAIQNMNAMFGLAEHAGLTHYGL